MTPRRPNWPPLLAGYFAARRNMPFAWGVHDCCQFARRAIEAITGTDPAAAWDLPVYSTALPALRYLRAQGGLEALPVKAGFTAIPIARAGRGDIVLADFAGAPVLGVCAGALAAFPGKTKLVFVPTLQCRGAWRV